MDYLLYVKQKLKEANITNYEIDVVLHSVEVGNTINVGESDNTYFFVNAFSATAIDGEIVSQNSALNLSPQLIESQIAKIKGFKGNLTITNRGLNPMYCEFIVVKPISSLGFEATDDYVDVSINQQKRCKKCKTQNKQIT